MMILALMLALQADEAAIRAEGWANKAKPITTCAADCDAKWARAKDWIRKNSRFQIAVDRDDLFATYGAVYANTDLSFVLTRRQQNDGSWVFLARAWCGNVITCKPKPKDAMAALKREMEG